MCVRACGAVRQVRTEEVLILDLHSNQIGDKGVAALAGTCARCMPLPNLKELNLSENHLGDAACASLAEAFGRGAMRSLQELMLGCNEIGNDGLASLAAAATAGAPALNGDRLELLLEENRIGDEGLKALTAAVAAGAFASMTILALDENLITSDGLRALAAGVEVPAAAAPSAEGGEGGAAAAPLPPRLPALEKLDLDGNADVDAAAYEHIAAALAAGALPALKILEVDDEMIALPPLAAACKQRNVSLW